jgi:hypothetical protein
VATGYLEARFETSGPLNETGTGPYSTKQMYFPLISFRPALGPSHLMRDDELRNQDEPLQILPEIYTPSWEFESRNYPDSVGFMMTLMLGQPSSIQGVNGGTVADQFGSTIPGGCYRHRWAAPFGPAGAFPYTATFRAGYKDQSMFFASKGAGATSLSIETPEQGGSRIRLSGPSLTMGTIADPSLSPTYEALTIPPFMRSHLTLPAWLASTATTEDFSVSIENPMEASRSLGIASRYPDLLEKADTPITFTGSIPKRQLDADDFVALRDATAFSGTARWQNTAGIGTTAFKYQLVMVFDSLQYTEGGPQTLENRRRIGQDLNFKATYDGSGSSVQVELVNATAAYT